MRHLYLIAVKLYARTILPQIHLAESLNVILKKKRRLPTAVPTLVNTPTTVREPKKEKNTGKHCIIGDKKKKGTGIHQTSKNGMQLFNLQPISKTWNYTLPPPLKYLSQNIYINCFYKYICQVYFSCPSLKCYCLGGMVYFIKKKYCLYIHNFILINKVSCLVVNLIWYI